MADKTLEFLMFEENGDKYYVSPTWEKVRNKPEILNGEDGVSPTVEVREIENGYEITITDSEGSSVFNIMNGSDGEPGAPGSPGSPGAPGSDGVSPTVAVTDITGGKRVTITDRNGSKSFDILNGKDGKDGEDGSPGSNGSPGKDGVDGVGIKSVTQTTTSTADGGENVITVTLTNGSTATFKVKNGSKGSQGNPGKDGTDATVTTANIKNALGYTPADAEVVSELSEEIADLKALLIDGNEVAY